MNYFELYPGDYLRDTSRLSLVDHGAYLKLMMAYYGEEEPLPAAYAELYVIVAAVSAADKAAVKKVADRYFPVSDDGLRHNGRADEEIAKAQKRIQTARENGAKNKAKANPAGNPAGMPVGGSTDTQRDTRFGEALHMPHAILPTDTFSPTTPAAAVGVFEGHDAPRETPNPAAPLAIALNRAGVQVTSLNPDLIEAQREGVTAAALVELAGLDDFRGKPAAYVIKAARRMHAEGAKPITGESHESTRKLSAGEQVRAAIRARSSGGTEPAYVGG